MSISDSFDGIPFPLSNEELWILIETPNQSKIKYEYCGKYDRDIGSNFIKASIFLNEKVPAAYGIIPHTIYEDYPINSFVVTSDDYKLDPLSIVKSRVISGLSFFDVCGKKEVVVICTPNYSNFESMHECPEKIYEFIKKSNFYTNIDRSLPISKLNKQETSIFISESIKRRTGGFW